MAIRDDASSAEGGGNTTVGSILLEGDNNTVANPIPLEGDESEWDKQSEMDDNRKGMLRRPLDLSHALLQRPDLYGPTS